MSQDVRVSASRELPAWLWLWWPPVVFVVMFLLVAEAPRSYRWWFERKEGPLEWLQVLVLLPAIAAGLLALRDGARVPWRGFRPFVAIVTLAAVYFCGEELSWGQHLVGWQTPDAWQSVNRQQETNLHNVAGLFDYLPRTLFELWVLGGMLFAARGRARPTPSPSDWRAWVWPTFVCVPTAFLAIAVRVPDRIEKLVGKFTHPVLGRVRLSEPQEYYFALFLLLFLLSICVRVRALASEPADYRKSRTAGLPLSSR